MTYYFQVHNVMILNLYLLQNGRHDEYSYHPSPHIVNTIFVVMRTFKICCLSNFQLCSTVLLTSHYTVCPIPSPYLSYNWEFVPLTLFTHFVPHPRLWQPHLDLLESELFLEAKYLNLKYTA